MASVPKRGKLVPASSVLPETGLVDIVETLQAIDTSSPSAILNATTISDNNGGRIEL